jgi:hypothetical protein
MLEAAENSSFCAGCGGGVEMPKRLPRKDDILERVSGMDEGWRRDQEMAARTVSNFPTTGRLG